MFPKTLFDLSASVFVLFPARKPSFPSDGIDHPVVPQVTKLYLEFL